MQLAYRHDERPGESYKALDGKKTSPPIHFIRAEVRRAQARIVKDQKLLHLASRHTSEEPAPNTPYDLRASIFPSIFDICNLCFLIDWGGVLRSCMSGAVGGKTAMVVERCP